MQGCNTHSPHQALNSLAIYCMAFILSQSVIRQQPHEGSLQMHCSAAIPILGQPLRLAMPIVLSRSIIFSYMSLL